MTQIVKIKSLLDSINKFYFFNFAIIFALVFSIFMNFAVQFKVESLQSGVKGFEVEISDYSKQIDNLEVEWAFLTRPSRLRELSNEYLTNSGNTNIAQIKSDVEMKEFFAANYELSKVKQFALAD